ncbi:alpha/beta hydrolase [Qipengyuania sp. 1XM1-15A]|uniref:alpha/beta fold hydrolase n=1 Tax=Qipengyuania xiamenensis TaxID=2867237 RepID=UPI001C887DA5|nr:alpha/beta hydrolase [Qipengyuania xiamenensis]MBX7533173.1 alpha/beta hydrolase [Qipengyuania xiamenensis]
MTRGATEAAITGTLEKPIDRRAIPANATESCWTAEDGHELRRIDWKTPSQETRGSLLFLPGRGDFYEKYLESLEEWHRAGWRVTAADWRGQAGSGRLGDDRLTGHVEDFSDWVADLKHFWDSWIQETPGPHVLVAHSMGGHIVARALVDGAIKPDAVVLSAPMLGMAGPPLPLAVLHSVARVMTRIGSPKRPAWKWSEKPGEMPARRRDLLTHDDDRYDDELWWREKRPELAMGPGSWGWVERAYASTRELEKPGAMENVQVPVLVVSTSIDKLVDHKAAVRAAGRFPNGELIEFGPEAHHEILREVDAVRGKAMDGISAFLDKVAPAAT